MKNQLHFFLITLMLFFCSFQLYAQIGINTDGSLPDNSAMLDVKSTSKGVLIPRLTQNQMQNMSNHTNGLLVFCISDSKFYAYNQSSSTWKELLYGPSSITTSWSLNDSVSIGWEQGTATLTANNNHIFLLSLSRDSLYVYDAQTLSFNHKQYLPNDAGLNHNATWKNNRLYVQVDEYNLSVYDASDVNNLTLLQNLNLPRGFLVDQFEDQTYLFWVAHWAQKVQIMNVSSNPVVFNQYVGVNGNPYGAARNGNYAYVSNAYSQNVRLDITNPNSCIVIPFGNSAGVTTGVTNSGFLVQGHGTSVPTTNWNVKLYDGNSGSELAIITNCYLGLLLSNNYCIVYDYSDNMTKLYNISSGAFVFVKNLWTGGSGMLAYNDQSIFRLYNNKIYKYNRGL